MASFYGYIVDISSDLLNGDRTDGVDTASDGVLMDDASNLLVGDASEKTEIICGGTLIDQREVIIITGDRSTDTPLTQDGVLYG